MDGIAIGVIEENTDIVIEGSTHLTVLRNATEEIVILTNRDLEHTLTDLQPLEILWINPETHHNCTPTPHILSGTKITSLKPLSVFTTEATCNNMGGSSELVHQMPPVSKWGVNFILDMQQANIIPPSLTQYLHYQFTILTSSNHTTNLAIDYYYHSQPHLNSPHTEHYPTSSNKKLIIPVNIQSDTLSHFHIHASDPILVMYEIHSLAGGNVSYSVLLQPTEWFSRQQTLILSHHKPRCGHSQEVL